MPIILTYSAAVACTVGIFISCIKWSFLASRFDWVPWNFCPIVLCPNFVRIHRFRWSQQPPPMKKERKHLKLFWWPLDIVIQSIIWISKHVKSILSTSSLTIHSFQGASVIFEKASFSYQKQIFLQLSSSENLLSICLRRVFSILQLPALLNLTIFNLLFNVYLVYCG